MLTLITIAACIATVIGALMGVWVYLRPTLKRRAAADQAILGVEEIKDLGGGITQVGQPGLVHVTRENSERLSKVEKAVTTLAEVLANQKELSANQHKLSARVDGHELRLNEVQGTIREHDTSIAFLIGDKFERGAKAALSAVEKQGGVIDVQPDAESE